MSLQMRFGLAAGLLLLALNGCHKSAGIQVGDASPEVVFQNFKGHEVHIPRDFKGKTLLLRFWSIDCHFCDKGMLKGLETLFQKYRQIGFIPVAINEGPINPDDERLNTLRSTLSYPILFEPYGLAAKQLGLVALPVTLIIDQEGIVRDKISGEAALSEYEQRLNIILKN